MNLSLQTQKTQPPFYIFQDSPFITHHPIFLYFIFLGVYNLIQQMEAASVPCVCIRKQEDNKENVAPPPLSSNANNPIIFSVISKREYIRKPLRDITHLFNNQIPPPPFARTQFQSPATAAATTTSSCSQYIRKRKAVDYSPLQATHSKSLRMNFR